MIKLLSKMAKTKAPQEEQVSEDIVDQELTLNTEDVPTEDKSEQLAALSELGKPSTPGHPSRDLGKTRNQ